MANAYEKLLESETGRRALAEEHAITNVTELICELLEKHDMKRGELAKKMGVTAGRVTQILDGDANMKLSTIAHALYAFGQVLEVSSRSIDDHQSACVWEMRRPTASPWTSAAAYTRNFTSTLRTNAPTGALALSGSSHSLPV